MKIAISNLGWDMSINEETLVMLRDKGVKALEIAPKKIFEDLASVSDEEALAYQREMNMAGLDIVAFQAFLFGRPELKLFDDSTREEMTSYIKKIIELAGKLGVRALVYGAPKSRDIMERDLDECYDIAVEFFRELGEYALYNKTTFCIEANAEQYNCNFINRAEDAAQLVRNVNSDGFKLHLDTACMHLAQDDFKSVIQNNIDILHHFHVSEPFLKDFSKPEVPHKKIAEALKSAGYKGYVSIEMLPSTSGIDGVSHALDFISHIYG